MESFNPEKLLELSFGYSPVLATIIYIFFFISVLIKTLTQSHGFYEYFRKRRLSNLDELIEKKTDNPELNHYLNSQRQSESLKIALGYDIKDREPSILLILLNKRLITRKRLKHVIRHISTTPDSKIDLSIDLVWQFYYAYCFVGGLVLLLVAILLIGALAGAENVIASILGLMIMMVASAYSGIMIRDYQNYKYVMRLECKLKDAGLLGKSVIRKKNKVIFLDFLLLR